MKWKISIFLYLLKFVKANEYYDESLELNRINGEYLKSEFHFEIERKYSKNDEYDFIVFPRSIQEIIDEYSIKNLNLNIGFGRWNTEKWGMPPQPFSSAGGQIFTEFQNEKTKNRFEFLLESINGLLCTSISQKVLVVNPVQSIFGNAKNQTFSTYGVSSTESACTENLTKLKKLLPCKNNGLSTLLHPSKLYNVQFHSSQLKVENDCNWNDDKCTSKMELDILVFFKIETKKNVEIFTSDLFERKLPSKCAAARKSEIQLKNNFKEIKTINLMKDMEFPLNIEIPKSINDKNNFDSDNNILRTWSSQGGFDQHRGVLSISMKNMNEKSKVLISQILPYFVRPRYSEIRIECQRSEVEKEWTKANISKKEMVLKNERKGSVLLQYELEMNSNHLCVLTIPFEKKLLKLADYPPDANHGLHIPPAIIFVSTETTSYSTQSNPILVILPVPDFSMPFNIICFVVTAFVSILGPIQLYSTSSFAPEIRKAENWKKVSKFIILILIGFCLFAHFQDLSLNEVRRKIQEHLQKLNDLK